MKLTFFKLYHDDIPNLLDLCFVAIYNFNNV